MQSKKHPQLVMSEASQQEMEIILKKKSLQREIADIRKRYGITPARSRKLANASIKDKKDLQENLEYQKQIRQSDMHRLRNIGGLTHVSDFSLKCYVLFGSWVIAEKNFVNPRQWPGWEEREDNAGRRRFFIRVFRNTTIPMLKQVWKDEILEWRKYPAWASAKDGIGGRVKIIDTPFAIEIEISPRTRLHHIVSPRIWKKIKSLQAQLPGIAPFRRKPNFGRDRTALAKRLHGKSAKRIYDEMEKFPTGNPMVSSEAYRQAIHRLKKRLT